MNTAVVGDDDLGDAIASHLRSLGACIPDGMRAYVTEISVSQDTHSLPRVEVSMILSEVDHKSRKHRCPWVRVKDRLPETDDNVLVCLDESVLIGQCDEDGVFVRADSYRPFRPQPSHWMPLPRGPSSLD